MATRSSDRLPLSGSIQAIVDSSDIARLGLIGRDYTGAISRCTAGVARALTAGFARAVRTGAGGVGIPPLGRRHPISQILRGPFYGGRRGPTAISEKAARGGNYGAVGMWIKAGRQCIGFKTASPPAAFLGQTLQTALSRRMTAAERRYLAGRLGSRAALIRSGRVERPARPILEPFCRHLAKVYPRDLLARLDTEAARILKKRAKQG